MQCGGAQQEREQGDVPSVCASTLHRHWPHSRHRQPPCYRHSTFCTTSVSFTESHLWHLALSGAKGLLVGPEWGVQAAGIQKRCSRHIMLQCCSYWVRNSTPPSPIGTIPFFNKESTSAEPTALSRLKIEVQIPLPDQIQQKIDSACSISQISVLITVLWTL